MAPAQEAAAFSEIDFQHVCQRTVDREVIYCVSTLFFEVTKDYERILALDLDEDDIAILRNAPDYEGAVRDWIDDCDYETVQRLCDERGLDAFGDCLNVLPAFLEQTKGFEKFAEQYDIEPHNRKVFEHWIVSSWLAMLLKSRGESVVGGFLGLTIWGRTTTGQAVMMDSVIRDIVRTQYQVNLL